MSNNRKSKWKWDFAPNGWADHICPFCDSRVNTDVHVGWNTNYCPECGKYMYDDEESNTEYGRAYWIVKYEDKYPTWTQYVCSNCGKGYAQGYDNTDLLFKYCPDCGFYMTNANHKKKVKRYSWG